MALAVLPDILQCGQGCMALLRRMKERFGRSLRLAVAPDYHGNDRFRIEQAACLAEAVGLPLMATNDVLYHSADRRTLQDVLTAIRLNVPVAEAGFELAANAERHMKPPGEMMRLFRRHPQALAETLRFAESLSFSLKDLEYNYPDEPTQSGLEPQAELERLTWEGAEQTRFPGGVPADELNKITYQNAMRWYSFDPFVGGRTRESATVGALRAEAAGHDVSIRSRDKGRFQKSVGIEMGRLAEQATA